MSRPPPWIPLKTEPLHDCRVFEVVRDHTRSPRDGQTYDFFRLHATDWVNVVPLTAANEIVMVAQYRHGSRRVTLEIPGGMVDPGEEPADAAGRELLEETGYRAGSIEKLGDISPNPAILDNRLQLFVARDVEWEREIANSAREETSVEIVPLESVPELVRSGEIDHALVVAAFYWLDHAPGGDGGR